VLAHCPLKALTGYAGAASATEKTIFWSTSVITVQIRWSKILKGMNLDDCFHSLA